MKHLLKTACTLTVLTLATQQAVAQVNFFENEGFGGRSFSTERQIGNFERFGFNNRASSVQVVGGRWEVCEEVRFQGRCIVLRPGRYPSLSSMGLNDRLSSAREVDSKARIDEARYATTADPFYDSRRRNGERLYQARVTSVRAVVATPEQRCWVERQAVGPNRAGNDANQMQTMIAEAFLGGVLGHQVGAGGRTQEVQRCATVPQQHTRPDYWDVTYTFRGQEHRIQMSAAPGRMVSVNRQGEPRAR